MVVSLWVVMLVEIGDGVDGGVFGCEVEIGEGNDEFGRDRERRSSEEVVVVEYG